MHSSASTFEACMVWIVCKQGMGLGHAISLASPSHQAGTLEYHFSSNFALRSLCRGFDAPSHADLAAVKTSSTGDLPPMENSDGRSRQPLNTSSCCEAASSAVKNDFIDLFMLETWRKAA